MEPGDYCPVCNCEMDTWYCVHCGYNASDDDWPDDDLNDLGWNEETTTE